MKKAKKLEPQSQESAWKWLTSFSTKPDEGKPLFELVKVQDGRAYATNGNILASVGCDLYSDLAGTLYTEDKNSNTNADIKSYPAVQSLTPVIGNEFVLNTEDLIAGLKKVAVLTNEGTYKGKPALLIRDRELQCAYLYASNGKGAAISVILGHPGKGYKEVYTRYSGGWIFPNQWLKLLKGWSRGKHGWPDSAGSYLTVLTFEKPRPKLNKPGVFNWFSNLVKLAPFEDRRTDAPFGLIMNQLGELGIETAQQAWELAESAQTDSEYWPDTVSRIRYKRILHDLDLPLFQGVAPFELGKAPTKEEWIESHAADFKDMERRAYHYHCMRNHPAMRLYNHPEAVAHGEHIGPFIEAIKASQKP